SLNVSVTLPSSKSAGGPTLTLLGGSDRTFGIMNRVVPSNWATMAPQNEVQATAIGDVMKRTKKFRRSSPFLGAGAGLAGIDGFATAGAAADGVAAGAGAAGFAGSTIASYLSRSVAHRGQSFACR